MKFIRGRQSLFTAKDAKNKDASSVAKAMEDGKNAENTTPRVKGLRKLRRGPEPSGDGAPKEEVIK